VHAVLSPVVYPVLFDERISEHSSLGRVCRLCDMSDSTYVSDTVELHTYSYKTGYFIDDGTEDFRKPSHKRHYEYYASWVTPRGPGTYMHYARHGWY
jgi:hypothetical protein